MEELVYEDLNGNPVRHLGDYTGNTQGEAALPAFNRLAKGVSSPVISLVVRNLSETHTFVGFIVTSPVAGRSYAEDIELSAPGEPWSSRLPLRLAPGEAYRFSVRVLVVSTPSDAVGRGAAIAAGKFELLEVA